MYKVFIKNMVCDRCILAVKNELDRLGLKAENVILGEAILTQEPSPQELKELQKALEALGFERMDDKKSKIIEKIKSTIIQTIQSNDGDMKTNLSLLISETLGMDYTYLSNLFSEVEGTTIEKYFIAQRIEKVKELLVYDELSLNEIAYRLHYSSAAYLSNQFKKVTGLTPGHFKKIKEEKRKPLDQV